MGKKWTKKVERVNEMPQEMSFYISSIYHLPMDLGS